MKTVTGQEREHVLIWRERLAAQIVAVMQADFRRPGPEEMLDVLRCAESQITVIKRPALCVLPSPAKSKVSDVLPSDLPRLSSQE